MATEADRRGDAWPRHLLDVAELSWQQLRKILDEAERQRDLLHAKGTAEETLAGLPVALLFAEPSTRTRLSFELAARNLTAKVLLLDPGSSSLVKGESLSDTCRTLDALGFAMLVLRHHRSGAPWVAARHFGGSVVNAGDGWHAHPTQALLDLLTLLDAFGARDLQGRKIAVVGDLRHSRVARSNVWTLTAAGAHVWACGPPALVRGFDTYAQQLPGDRRLTVTDKLQAALEGADAVMALRIQFERMEPGSLSKGQYIERYGITEARLARHAGMAYFLHPGPVNEGVEVTRQVARGPRSLVLAQVRNGVPVRMAVLAALAYERRELSSARR